MCGFRHRSSIILTLLSLVVLGFEVGCSRSDSGDNVDQSAPDSTVAESDVASGDDAPPVAPSADTPENSQPESSVPTVAEQSESWSPPEYKEVSSPAKPPLPPLPDVDVLNQEAATLDIEGCTPRPVSGDTVQLYLRNCLEYTQADEPDSEKQIEDGLLEFKVVRGGLVLLKVSWAHESGRPRSGTWMKDVVKEEDFRKQDWIEVQNLGNREFVFAKEFESGETYRLRTKAFESPVAYASLPLENAATLRDMRTPAAIALTGRRYRSLLRERKFEELDKIAEQLRTSKKKFRSGESQLYEFYQALAIPEGQQNSASFLRQKKRLMAWKPKDSPTAIIAAALSASSHTAADRPKIPAATYQRRIEAVYKALKSAESVAATDAVLHFARAMTSTSDSTKIDSASIEAMKQHTQNAVTVDRSFLKPITGMFRILLYVPKAATAEQIVEFADSAVEWTKDELGESLYSILATEAQFAHSRPFYQKFKVLYDFYPQFSRERVRQGLIDWEERFPHSDFDLERRCLMACYLGDRDTAYRMFEKIGDQYNRDVWPRSGAYRKWRAAHNPASASGQQSKYIFGHLGVIDDIAYSPDGTRIASFGNDGNIRIWDVATGEMWREYRVGAIGAKSVAFSADGHRLYTGIGLSQASRLVIWNLDAAADAPHETEFDDHQHVVSQLAVPKSGNVFASATFSGRVRVWDVKSMQSRQIYPTGPPPKGFSSSKFPFIHLSEDGSRLLMVQKEGELVTFDAQSGSEVGRLKVGGHPASRAFSPDGKLLAVFDNKGSTSQSAGTVRIWNILDQAEIASIEPGGTRHSTPAICFSRDGKRIAFAQEDLFIWDFESDKPPLRLKGHQGRVMDVVFAPDDKRVVTAGEDFSLRLWDLR